MTCSRILSQRLWEKGLRIETEKWWVCRKPNIFELEYHKPFSIYANFPAYSTDELLAVMPITINNRFLTIKKTLDKNFVVEYPNNYLDERTIQSLGGNLPEALGKMVEWLLDSGYKYDEVAKCLRKE